VTGEKVLPEDVGAEPHLETGAPMVDTRVSPMRQRMIEDMHGSKTTTEELRF
jgi:hypothetical protein